MACRTAFRPLTRSARTQFQSTYPSRCFSNSIIRPVEPSSAGPSNSDNGRTTHFGYETVPEAEKEARVRGVFSSVAASYDTMNDFMSLGIHRLWKDHFVRSINPGFTPPSSSTSTPNPGWKMLDIAGGTGDIAFRLLDHATNINASPSSTITISDINPEMLAEGRKRSLQTSYAHSPRLNFLLANAESLPMIPSNSLDLYTVAFGIRNFTNKSAALREAHRVLKPGGLFACLEFSGVTNPLFNAVYKRWSFGAIPLIGQLVAGDRDSYQYLVESIEKFPKQEEFRDMIKEAGFVVPGKGWEDLTGGIAAIHKGIKRYCNITSGRISNKLDSPTATKSQTFTKNLLVFSMLVQSLDNHPRPDTLQPPTSHSLVFPYWN